MYEIMHDHLKTVQQIQIIIILITMSLLTNRSTTGLQYYERVTGKQIWKRGGQHPEWS